MQSTARPAFNCKRLPASLALAALPHSKAQTADYIHIKCTITKKQYHDGYMSFICVTSVAVDAPQLQSEMCLGYGKAAAL